MYVRMYVRMRAVVPDGLAMAEILCTYRSVPCIVRTTAADMKLPHIQHGTEADKDWVGDARRGVLFLFPVSSRSADERAREKERIVLAR